MASESTKNTIRILEQGYISPPPGFVPPTQLPLTFFDIPWITCCPIEVLFFYHLPQPTQHFTTTIIPNLKTSLPLALRHFFPLAADLHLPPAPHKPYLLYSGAGSVQFTVAESSADFNALIANHERDVKELHPFVPKLPESQPSNDEAPTYVLPVFALQVTIFPNFGFCIGHNLNHVAADGRSMSHFMKSWSSICKNIKTLELTTSDGLLEQEPWHDRSVIKNVSRVVDSEYSWFWNLKKDKSVTDLTPLEGMVRATFFMGRFHIERLKVLVSAQFVSNKETQTPLHVSTFAVTSAFLWVHLVKSCAIGVESDNICYFHMLVDCRNRKGFEFPVPETYFGNCLASCIVKMKRSELVGENGIYVAAATFATKIKELEDGALKRGDKWTSEVNEAQESENFTALAGSPNLRVYDIDFGWGRPKKIELVHIDISRSVSVSESGEKKGGIEIGVALYRDKMDAFVASFEQGLKSLS